MDSVGQLRSKHLEEAIANVEAMLRTVSDETDDFDTAADAITTSLLYGRGVYFIGVGKSGIVGQKLAASFRSFGLRSFYLHAGDCSHGDLGAVERGDTVIALTHSGTTDEVVRTLEALDSKLGQNYRLILITSSAATVEALDTDAVLTYRATELLEHVPTVSCVAQLLYGDALLSEILERLQLGLDDFAMNHPGGNLGRLLTNDA